MFGLLRILDLSKGNLSQNLGKSIFSLGCLFPDVLKMAERLDSTFLVASEDQRGFRLRRAGPAWLRHVLVSPELDRCSYDGPMVLSLLEDLLVASPEELVFLQTISPLPTNGETSGDSEGLIYADRQSWNYRKIGPLIQILKRNSQQFLSCVVGCKETCKGFTSDTRVKVCNPLGLFPNIAEHGRIHSNDVAGFYQLSCLVTSVKIEITITALDLYIHSQALLKVPSTCPDSINLGNFFLLEVVAILRIQLFSRGAT